MEVWRKCSGIPEERTSESTGGVKGDFKEEVAFELQIEWGIGVCPVDKRSNTISGRGKGMVGQSWPWKPEVILYFISCKLGGKCYKRLGEEGEKAADSRALKTLPKKCRYHPGGDEEALKGLSWGVSYSDLCFRKIRLEAVWILDYSLSLKTSSVARASLACLYEDWCFTQEPDLKSPPKVVFSPPYYRKTRVPPISQITFWALQMLVCQPSNINPSASAMPIAITGSFLGPSPSPLYLWVSDPSSPSLKEKVLNQIPVPLQGQPLPSTCYMLLRCPVFPPHTSTTMNLSFCLNL